MARRKLRLKGDFQGDLQEDITLLDVGKIRVKNAPQKPKVKDKFLTTDHGSGLPLGELIAKPKGTGKIKWKYNLDNDDPRVQALAAGEQITETYKIIVKARGAKTAKHKFKVVITGENDAPEITSDGGGENAAINVDENTTAVTTVTADDVDNGANVTFSIVGGADQSKFQINGTTGVLSFIAPPDFEIPTDNNTNNAYEVIVRADDGLGGVDDQTITVQVQNLINENPPIIISDGAGAAATINVDENTTAVTTVDAIDQDGSTPIYSIVGGTDQDKFQINGTTGALSFITAPDFEVPTDSDADNAYEVVVRASDGTFFDDQTITVQVQNESNESPPVITSDGGGATASINVDENTTAVTTVVATDADGTTPTYSIVGGADQTLFQIDGTTGSLSFIGPPDFEFAHDDNADNAYEVTVRASDGAFLDDQAITVQVQNVSDDIPLFAFAGRTGLFRILGADAYDYSGTSVSSAGDINGDGFDDVIVGAPLADALGNFKNRAGESYVIFGKASGLDDIDLEPNFGNLLGNGFRIVGADGGTIAGDVSGYSVSSAGDVNGDGFDDLIIGSPGGDASGNAKSGAGESYVIFGKGSGFVDLDLATLSASDGFRIFGADAGDQSGRSVSSAGDINGDGFGDLIIGAAGADASGNAKSQAGESYVIFGKASGFADIDLATLSTSDGFRIFGADAGDVSGFSVSSAGDINGDGFADVIIGAFAADANGNTKLSAGESYVIFGKASGFADIDLATLAPTDGFRIFGTDGGISSDRDYSGRSVSSAGDVNGDGYDDLIIGAPRADAYGNAKSGAGESYVIFGKASGFADIDLATLAPTDGFRIFGTDAGDQSGYSVSSAGDVNGDGFADLIVGAYLADAYNNANSAAGESYVIFGKASGFTDIDVATLTPSDGFRIFGAEDGFKTGYSVSSAGDVNGDGFDDLIIGAPFAYVGYSMKTYAGASYVLFGAAFGASDTPVNTAGTTGGEILIGALGDDILTGNGGADVFHAGAGDDTLTVSDLNFHLADGGSGVDTLVLDGSGVTFDFTTLPDTKTQGIEVVDFTGSGNNTLKLALTDAINLSDELNFDFSGVVDAPKAVVVEGDTGDTLELAPDARGAWTLQASDVNLDGSPAGNYDIWSFQASGDHYIKLAVDHDVGVTLL
jgi:VCBS repeat-containing protein